MGGSSSKRKLTIENEDPTSVIKVSENVVDRIRGTVNTVSPKEVVPPQAALPLYMCEPSLTSIQLRQAHVVELQENDDYWQNRVKCLEEEHKKINELMTTEYNKAVQEIEENTFKKSSTENVTAPCKESKDAVMQCYKCYPDEPMRCSKLVRMFQDCVERKRYEIMDQQKRG